MERDKGEREGFGIKRQRRERGMERDDVKYFNKMRALRGA